MAAAFDDKVQTSNEAQESLMTAVRELKLNPWCGICGSRELKCETGQTRFTTMAEAQPHLYRSEIAQLSGRQILEQRGLTHDSARKN